ncbi:unnamed protein product [Closterium sp. Naga37s-1]|nr:unnamed protein product [Closterium sp. Naga37s-1]
MPLLPPPRVSSSSRAGTVSLENAQDLAASDARHLRDTVRVPQNDADLRRRQTLLRELADVLVDLPSISGQKVQNE